MAEVKKSLKGLAAGAFMGAVSAFGIGEAEAKITKTPTTELTQTQSFVGGAIEGLLSPLTDPAKKLHGSDATQDSYDRCQHADNSATGRKLGKAAGNAAIGAATGGSAASIAGGAVMDILGIGGGNDKPNPGACTKKDRDAIAKHQLGR